MRLLSLSLSLSLEAASSCLRVSYFLENPLTNAYTKFYIFTTIIKFYVLLYAKQYAIQCLPMEWGFLWSFWQWGGRFLQSLTGLSSLCL